jgi:pathogenesis-related protein 1
VRPLLLALLLAAALPAQPVAAPMLAAHNAVRARLSLPALEWSPTLAAHARQWAERRLARRQFFHRPDTPYGENLFSISGAPATPAQVVHSWASEAAAYDPATNSCRTEPCGHYTQIVWRDTRRLGCAVARNSRREVWVCNYDPPGNFIGQRPY